MSKQQQKEESAEPPQQVKPSYQQIINHKIGQVDDEINNVFGYPWYFSQHPNFVDERFRPYYVEGRERFFNGPEPVRYIRDPFIHGQALYESRRSFPYQTPPMYFSRPLLSESIRQRPFMLYNEFHFPERNWIEYPQRSQLEVIRREDPRRFEQFIQQPSICYSEYIGTSSSVAPPLPALVSVALPPPPSPPPLGSVHPPYPYELLDDLNDLKAQLKQYQDNQSKLQQEIEDLKNQGPEPEDQIQSKKVESDNNTKKQKEIPNIQITVKEEIQENTPIKSNNRNDEQNSRNQRESQAKEPRYGVRKVRKEKIIQEDYVDIYRKRSKNQIQDSKTTFTQLPERISKEVSSSHATYNQQNQRENQIQNYGNYNSSSANYQSSSNNNNYNSSYNNNNNNQNSSYYNNNNNNNNSSNNNNNNNNNNKNFIQNEFSDLKTVTFRNDGNAKQSVQFHDEQNSRGLQRTASISSLQGNQQLKQYDNVTSQYNPEQIEQLTKQYGKGTLNDIPSYQTDQEGEIPQNGIIKMEQKTFSIERNQAGNNSQFKNRN